MNYLIVNVLFFFSGFASLVLEVTWSRLIGILFGHTVQGASIVLASYFAGMTIGYFLGRRLVTKKMSPLAVYGICEIFAGLWALAVPGVLGWSQDHLPFVSGQYDSLFMQTSLRSLYAFVLLLPSTVAMGVTLPAVASFIRRFDPDQLGRKVVIAYGINTAGAVAGTLSVTTILMAFVGIQGASFTGALLAVAVGVIAVIFSTRLTLPITQTLASNATFKEVSKWPSLTNCTLAVCSGFCTLALQVLYTRLFSLVFHNSTYSFSTVVMAFLIALSAASLLFSRFNKILSIPTNMAALQQTGGVAVSISALLFLVITDLSYFGSVGNFTTYILSCAGLALAIIAIPVSICGMLLPWTWLQTDKNVAVEQQVARLSALNTTAAAIGSLVTCFVLLPFIGLWTSFALIASIYILNGAIIAFSTDQQKKQTLIFSTIALIFIVSSWKISTDRGHGTEEGDMIARFESAYGWVDVIETDESGLKLRQNIHYGLGSSGSISMERRQALIPLLLHPEPKSVLFLGLATGTTAGAAADISTVERIDIVELVPDVVNAAKLFSEFNRNILDNPKTTVFVNDGRHYLKQTTKRYDVITSDLFVPWESMTGYLYTVEHYQEALKKLTPNGIFTQWIPLWQLGQKEFEMIADSFAKVFPHTSVFYGKNDFKWSILGLMGSALPIDVNFQSLSARLEQQPSPLPKDKSWFHAIDDLFDLYTGDWPKREDAVLNTDNFPRVEFSTPITAWTTNQRLRYQTLENYKNMVFDKLPMSGNLLINGHSLTQEESDKIRRNQKFKFEASRK